jgi:hypothetical protein
MNSSQITNKIIREFPYVNEAFVRRLRIKAGWGVFAPSANEEEQEKILEAFGRPIQDHNLVGIVIPLSDEESASLDKAQTEFNKAGGYGSI